MFGLEVNKESHAPGEVWSVEVPPGRMAVIFCLNALDSGAGSRQALVYNWGGLVSPADTTPRAIRTTDRAALLTLPGSWSIYTANADLGGAKEDYLVIYVENLQAAAAIVSVLGSSALNKFELLKWGGSTVAAALAADATTGWAKALLGPIVNARAGAYSREGTEFFPIEVDDIAYATGKGEGVAKLVQTAAVNMGRDTTDSTLRAIQAEVYAPGGSTAQTGKYFLHVSSLMKAYRIGNSSVMEGIGGGTILANGASSSNAGLLTLGLKHTLDVDNSLFIPTAMSRYVRTETVNPTALQVVGTLDCRSQVKKSLRIDFTAADTARIQVSADGANWNTLEDIGGTPAAFAPTTAVLLRVIEGFRHVRVLAVAGFTGTATVTITAQGG